MSVGMTEVLGRYLDLTAEQMKVTASNMANIDTPGYKTQGFDFEQALGSAMGGEPVVAEVEWAGGSTGREYCFTGPGKYEPG